MSTNRTRLRTVTGRNRVARRRAPVRKSSPSSLKTKINTLSRRVNGDLNWKDLNFAPTQINYNGTVIGLSDYAQGDDAGQRDGLMQTNHSLELRLGMYGIYAGVAGAYGPCAIRVLLIVDKQNSISNASDVLYVTGSANAVVSVYNKFNRHRFEILKDRLLQVGANDPEKFTRMLINLKDKMQKYTTTTAGSVTQNVIKLILISNAAVASTFAPNVSYTGRLTYYS